MLNADYLFAILLALFLYFIVQTMMHWPGGHSFKH